MVDPQRDLIDDRDRPKAFCQAAQINGRQSSSSPLSFVAVIARSEATKQSRVLYPKIGLLRYARNDVPSSTHAFAEPVGCGLEAALAVRNSKRVEADFDDAQGAQNHRRVDMPHMGDAERLARQFADPDPEHHAAFLLAIALQRKRIVTV